MRLARVVGTAVSTVKVVALTGYKLLLIADVEPGVPQRPAGSNDVYVAVDLAGAGEGDVVLVTLGSAARISLTSGEVPTDASIIGIIDNIQYDSQTTFAK